ncbi:hypothetical protein HV092_22995 [Klebsiella quasipneumoniae]|uniref:hypothetical protein n=1 Tax=Klebsiella quasipneumoniae TaxID=1463165 RepID=UPI0015E590D0|nr:hypothetical protein [Klebsiella quasipneumoniae]QLP56178.1 hypothetical protein HV092_01145 [Klebsiella quasipneumoniae]QLP56960.1 hypothetical protein HV092_05390 [Klebsiella quasipneumoniae]QLP59000.1 hypothetical protein HV092_16755 [Klebsiella quasipneumoniae]QLP60140.1 hypothetical protein HV092_22995 [Klebsiella quasipneumoniae]
MARKKSSTTDLLPDVTLNPELDATQNLLATVSSQMNDERDLLNQLLGQAQMADAFAKFSKTVFISKLAFVKENKLYQSLSSKRSEDGLQYKGTWEEFCNLLGWAPQHANEAIANLTSFGEEALESMSRMGIGYRELRQFRRLPEDQKSALIEVAKEGDKTALLELAEEMIAKHAKEKEELKADLEVSRQMLAEKKEVINEMSMEREELKARLVRRSATETPDKEGEAIETETIGFKNGVLSSMLDLECNFKLLTDHTDNSGINHLSIMAATLDDIESKIIDLRNKFNIPEYRELDGPPEWIKEMREEGTLP